MDMNFIKIRPGQYAPQLRANTSYGGTTIVIVGCGGTGGRIIPNVAQHIVNHNQVIESNPNNKEYIKHKLRMIVIDMDTVEAKNLKRQNFYKFDIGRGKAEAMAERYSTLYGLDIEYFNKPFDECNLQQGRNAHGYQDTNFIIFDCTDNKVARESIEQFNVGGGQNTILISCGNEDTFGQVLVSTLNQRKGGRGKVMLDEIYNITKIIDQDLALSEPSKSAQKYSTRTLPTLLELFPSFKDTEKPSCTDMTLQNDQSMPINMLVAQIAYNAFYDIVSGKGMNYNMVRCNINNTYATDYINNLLAMRNLYILALFGTLGAGAERVGIEWCKNQTSWIRNNAGDFLEKIKDLGPLRYGLMSAYCEFGQNNYKQLDFDKVQTQLEGAKKELLEFLEGGA